MTHLEIGLTIFLLIAALILLFVMFQNSLLKDERDEYKEMYELELDRRTDNIKSDKQHMMFAEAIEFVKIGKRVANRNWHMSGQIYIFLQPGITITDIQTPNPVLKGIASFNNGKVKIEPYLMFKDINSNVNVWNPTMDDLLSNNWYILPE